MVVYVAVTHHSETSEVEFTSQISQIYSEYVFETHSGTLQLNGVEISVEVNSSFITVDLEDGPVEGEIQLPLHKPTEGNYFLC